MKKFCLTIFILIAPWLSAAPAIPKDAFWIKNHWDNCKGSEQIKPVHWRASQSTTGIKINKTGLENLFISGSASPTLGNMIWIKKTQGKNHPVYILDLRQETHLYIDGLPISLFYKRDEINWGKTPREISKEEQVWKKYFLKTGIVHLNKLGKSHLEFKIPENPVTWSVKEVSTEQETAEKAGIHYFRIEVPDYHPPTPAQVDQFLALIQRIPHNSWLHFHCAAGKGRTTTFMVMRDIVANGRRVSLEDIIARQKELGGINLFGQSPSLDTQPWKRQYHQARTEYIKLFYAYVHSGAYPTQSFGAWIKKQPSGPYKLILKSEAYVH